MPETVARTSPLAAARYRVRLHASCPLHLVTVLLRQRLPYTPQSFQNIYIIVAKPYENQHSLKHFKRLRAS